MTENRRFLLNDIVSMLPQAQDTAWLANLNEKGLYRLWQDLVNLTTMEAISE